MYCAHLHNEHVLCSPLKVHAPFSLIYAEILLVSADSIFTIENNENICICSCSKDITCKGFNFIGHNYR